MASRKRNEVTNKDVLDWIASQKLLPHDPNSEFEYSNSGYVMLAELVESVSQMRFADYLKKRVFDQLEMKDTFVFDETCAFADDAPEVINHARCYNRVKGQGFVPVGYTPLNFIYGDGNVHSTIVDMGLWDLQLHWLEKMSLVSTNKSDQKSAAKLRELLWAPVKVEKRKRVDYGAGWNLLRDSDEEEVEVNGKKVMRSFESRAEYHHGDWLGWQSYIARGSRWVDCEPGGDIELDTWESLGIVVLTNNKQFNTCGVAKSISQVYWGNLKKDNIMNRFEC
jgi:CubicO group peptidase (beta-lactamase class C family)